MIPPPPGLPRRCETLAKRLEGVGFSHRTQDRRVWRGLGEREPSLTVCLSDEEEAARPQGKDTRGGEELGTLALLSTVKKTSPCMLA